MHVRVFMDKNLRLSKDKNINRKQSFFRFFFKNHGRFGTFMPNLDTLKTSYDTLVPDHKCSTIPWLSYETTPVQQKCKSYILSTKIGSFMYHLKTYYHSTFFSKSMYFFSVSALFLAILKLSCDFFRISKLFFSSKLFICTEFLTKNAYSSFYGQKREAFEK